MNLGKNFQKLFAVFRKTEYPKHLKISGREKLPVSAFQTDDKLFRGYSPEDFDIIKGELKTETVRFPDLSCNWSRFSAPEDIRLRCEEASADGCYSFTVQTARFNGIANPVHEPLCEPLENYAHVEVRALKGNQTITDEPPKGQKITSDRKKQEYRQNLVNNSIIELDPR